MKRFYFGIGAVLSFVGGLATLGCIIDLPNYDFSNANQASQGIGGLAVEIIMEIEDAFEMSIPDEEAEKIHTVGDAIDVIERHGSGGAGVTAKLPPTPPSPREDSIHPDDPT